MNPNFREAWSPSAVFSPSAARQQLLEAKDWSYIDSWLDSHFSPSPVPAFERNPETLKALLALAGANEDADEGRWRVRGVKEKVVAEVRGRWEACVAGGGGVGGAAFDPVQVVSERLDGEGERAVGSLALLSVAVESGVSMPSGRGVGWEGGGGGVGGIKGRRGRGRGREREREVGIAGIVAELGKELVALVREGEEVVQARGRVEGLVGELEGMVRKQGEEEEGSGSGGGGGGGGGSGVPRGAEGLDVDDLAKKTNEWIYTSRHLRQKAQEYAQRAEAMERSWVEEGYADASSESPGSAGGGGGGGAITIQKVREMEVAVGELKELVVGLEAQVKGFQGLPPDRDVARAEVERVEALVRDLEGRREELYDRMLG